MIEPIELDVPNLLVGERADRAVSALTGFSRSAVEQLMIAGNVTIEGQKIAKSHRLEEGDMIVLTDEPRELAPPAAEDLPVSVVFADEDVIVIDKSAGMVVHPGAGVLTGTLVNALLFQFPEIRTVGDPMRPGIVHRLDKDTSGLMVVARNQNAFDALVLALSKREVSRSYVALVWGNPNVARGLIDAPIGRSQRQRIKMAIRDDGKQARTRFYVLAQADKVALVRFSLETGRTHQIRVHANSIGHPIVGDGWYGGVRESILLSRPFLHSESLEFAHPSNRGRLAFRSKLPPELATVLAGTGLAY